MEGLTVDVREEQTPRFVASFYSMPFGYWVVAKSYDESARYWTVVERFRWGWVASLYALWYVLTHRGCVVYKEERFSRSFVAIMFVMCFVAGCLVQLLSR